MNEQNRNKRKTTSRPEQNRPNPPQRVQRPPQSGQRSPQNAQKPIQNGARDPQSPRPSSQHPPIKRQSPQRKEPEAPPRRRNEESYVFSRSLSETRERILTERRERLEDARKFRREDVRDKLRKGFMAFGITLLLIIIATTVIISSALNANKLKKNKGEFIYKIGSKETELAYSDAILDGTLYISMNSLSELCGFTISGSTANDLRFYTEDGDWISFASNSNTATINGYGMPMPASAKINGTECSVPVEFLDTVLGGVTITIDEQKNTVSVKRDEYSDSTHLEPHYLPVSLMLKTNSSLSALDENKYFAGKPLFDFHNDLSAYEVYMNPTGEDANAFLLLLNKVSPIDSSFTPLDIVDIPDKWVSPAKRGDVTLELNSTATKALEAMLMEMHAEGFTNIFVTSAYRSYSYQSGLYNTYIQREMNSNPGLSYEEAKALVETYSAVPGYSEHHTGLCVDLISSDMIELTNDFAEKDAYEWLLANAWKFGFVLRYPADKENITGYSYESWHWRFVGRSTALTMLRSGMCFEEYLASMTEAH